MVVKEKKKKKKKKEKKSLKKFSLPTEKKEPLTRIGDYSILIHGEPKIGKTSVAAQFPDAFFLEFEPGTKGLSNYGEEVSSWTELHGWIKALDEDQSRFKTIVIDTVDIAYKQCREYVCRKRGVTHPGDVVDYGATWDMIATEFQKTMAKVQKLGRGVVFISHSQYKEVSDFQGNTRHRIMPTLSNSAAKIMIGMVDFIFYFYFGKEDARRLRIEGNADVEAGIRGEKDLHFKGLKTIGMGESAKEGYENLIKGFENKLKTKKKSKKGK